MSLSLVLAKPLKDSQFLKRDQREAQPSDIMKQQIMYKVHTTVKMRGFCSGACPHSKSSDSFKFRPQISRLSLFVRAERRT